MIEVNGRAYPLWSQFVEGKERWIGGTLEDLDRDLPEPVSTKITDITLTPNGPDSAMFTVEGGGFCCAGDVHHLGIVGGEPGWLTLNGYGGHEWRIKEKGPE